MNKKIMLQNVCVYTKDNKTTTRVGFCFGESTDVEQNKGFIGYPTMSCFYSGNLLDMFTPEMFNRPLDAEFKEVRSYKNNLDTRKMLKSFKYDGSVINLL